MKKIFLFCICLVVLLSVAHRAAHAGLFLNEDGKKKLQENTSAFQLGAGFENATPDTLYATIGTVINVFLGLLGIIFVGLMLYGGFRWMNAQGAEEEVEKAKDIILQAVIGLGIILASYAISFFVVSALQKATLRKAQGSAQEPTAHTLAVIR